MHRKVRARQLFRKFLRRFIPLALLAALLAGGAVVFHRHWIFIDGHICRRDALQLDLSGASLEQLHRIPELTMLEQLDLRGTGITAQKYEDLQSALPHCQILWEPSFQGQFYPLDTTEFTIDYLTEADVICLDYFKQLSSVDAVNCRDYDAILALIRRRPDCAVNYRIQIGQEAYPSDTAALTLSGEDLPALADMLPYLPKVSSVLVTGGLEMAQNLQALREEYPHIRFDYNIEFYGQVLESNAEKVDFCALPLTQAQEVEALLPYLPNLTEVDIRGCIIPPDQILALADRWPGIEFLWNLHLADLKISPDVTTLDLSGIEIEDAAVVEGILPYFPNLSRVLLTDCGLSNEELDTLNRKYEDIQIVWEVSLGPDLRVPTNITALIPTQSGAWLTDADTYNLRYCTELVALDLGHLDITHIDFTAFMPKLKYLIIADSQVASLEPLRGLQDLLYLEAFQSHVTDYSPLTECPALEDINISWTYGDYEPLCRISNLKRLWWGGTTHSTQEVYQLMKRHPDATFELYDGESTGSGWRQHPHYYEMRDLLGMYYMQ